MATAPADSTDALPPGGPRRTVTRKITIPVALLSDFPELDSRIWLLAAARFVVTAGFAAVMPFLAMHLAVEREMPILRIGALWTIVGLTGASMQWVAGELTHRIGRRRLLLGAMVVRSLNLAALGLAIGERASFPVIAVLCVINGAMRAFYDPAASAVVAELCSRDERVAAFSLHRVGSSLGWAAGPMVVALAPEAAYSAFFYVAAPVTLVAAGAVALIPKSGPLMPRPPRRWAQIAEFRHDTKFVRFLAATLAFFVLQTQMYHILPIYAATQLGLSRAQVGTLFVVNGLLVVLVQLPTAGFIRRIGTASALVVGSLGYLLAYGGVSAATGYLSLFACVVTATLCESVAVPAHQARLTALAPVDDVAGYAGIAGLVQGLAQTTGPLIGSFLIAIVPAGLGWLVIAVLGTAAALGFRRQASSP